MTAGTVERDERTIAVENAGYRWSYLVLSYGLLLIAVYRSLVRDQAVLDLIALTVLGGVVNAAYQGYRRVLYPRWIMTTVITLLLAAVVGFLAVTLGGRG